MLKKFLKKIWQSFKPLSKPSYAQCGEDIILDFLFSSLLRERGFFVDIGANDPIKYNNTYSLYRAGWRGVNIDPQESCILKFQKIRPRDSNLNIGVGEKSGSANFFVMVPNTLSTFDESLANEYIKMGHKLEEKKSVPIKSVGDLLKEKSLPLKIDLLSLDTEGGELSFLKQFISAGVYPDVVICETIEYAASISKTVKKMGLIEEITSMGYIVFADTYLNTIFIQKNLLKI